MFCFSEIVLFQHVYTALHVTTSEIKLKQNIVLFQFYFSFISDVTTALIMGFFGVAFLMSVQISGCE